MATGIVVVLGGFSLQRLPIDLLPDVTLPTLTVDSEYGTASPEEMERLVTEPIEDAVSLISGVVEIRSTSSEGSSDVRVEFAWGSDLDAASNDVRDRLDRITEDLPEDLPRPELRKFDVSNAPIVMLGIASPLSGVELTTLVDNQVLPRFQRLPGVASVEIWGEYVREIRVELDLPKVIALSLPLDQVLEAVRSANVTLPAGSVESGQFEVTVRTPGEFESLDELGATVVALRQGAPVRLRDIATLIDGAQDRTRLVRIDGQLGVRIGVRKQSDANTAQVAALVLRELERVERDFPQLAITKVMDQGRYIERAIANVGDSILYGGLLAVVVLIVFLRNLRSTLVIAVSIPISVVATFALIFFGGFSLNLMTLGGLALGVGLMVDNSIVVLENVFRRQRELGEAPRVAAVQGASEVAPAILASTLTTLVIFLPLVFVGGVAGILFRELALVVSFSLLVSLVAALTVVPALAASWLRLRGAAAAEVERSDGGRGALARVYSAVLGDALRRPAWTVLLAVGLVGGAALLVPRIGTEFLPPSDEGEVRVVGQMEAGTRLDLLDRQTQLLEQGSLPHVPELLTSLVSIGPSNSDPGAVSTGELQLALVPAAERSRSNVEIAEDLRLRLEGNVPGMAVRTRAPQGQRLLERILGGEEGLEVQVRGHDLEVLDALAAEAAAALRAIPGVTDVQVTRQRGAPQELVQIDRDRAADLGVSVRRIAETLETALGGTRAGEYREGGDEHRILVRLADARALTLEQVLDIPVRSDRGEDVALRNLVRVQSGRGPVVIERLDRQRQATLAANVVGRDLGSVAEDVQRALRAIPRPLGYDFALGGSVEEQRESFADLSLTLLLSLVLVYMVLAAQYESLRDPLAVMFAVPAAAVGVVVTLFLTGTTLNVQSFIGCILLGGIVVNNAILLVDQASRLRGEGRELVPALLEAGRRRLRPILMTSSTTLLGLLPLAIGLGEGAEAQAPLARAVVGGLTLSTLVTLVLVPAVYLLLHRPWSGPRLALRPRSGAATVSA
jgi:HAE1 family hydrophobic/amphiphilic exporter-1